MKIVKKLETVFAAVAFAEAGEPEIARQIMKESQDEHPKGGRKCADKGACETLREAPATR